MPVIAMAAALLAVPCLAPDAEAARVAKPRSEQAPDKPRADRPRAERAAASPRAERPAATARTEPGHAGRSAARTRPAPEKRAAQAPRAGRQAARQAAAQPRPAAAPAETISGARPVVVTALGHAVRSTGIDPALLTALAWQESRFEPRARNRLSSARGLMQFTEGTWLEAVRDHGPQHGLRYESAVLSTDAATGTITTRLPRTRSRILDLRDNPRYAAALAAERINRTRAALEATLGRRAVPADLYMIHLLGPGGATRFLSARDRTPGKPAVEFVSPESVAANPGVFTDRASGRSLSLAQVHAWVEGAIAGQVERHAPILAALGAPVVVQVAEAP